MQLLIRLTISNFLGEAHADKTGGDAPDQTGRNAETNSGGKREIVEARRNDPQPTARQTKTGGTKPRVQIFCMTLSYMQNL